jgi:zinc finger HIT domain-containing protein 3
MWRSCSLACSTVHKATHPALEPTQAAAKPEPKPQSIGAAPRPGTVAAAGYKGPFAALDDSKELQLLFKLYPKLPTLLDDINAATLRPLEELDNRAHNGYTKGKKEQPWTLDRGLEKGREALNRARDTDEGVREYSNLILQILSGDAGISAAELVQKELTVENTKIIEALLQGEL